MHLKCETIASLNVSNILTKCHNIDAIGANLILTLFVKIFFLFTISLTLIQKNFDQTTYIHTYVDTYGHRQYAPWGLSSRYIIIMYAFMQSTSRQQMHIHSNTSRVNISKYCKGKYIVAAAMQCVDLSPRIIIYQPTH